MAIFLLHSANIVIIIYLYSVVLKVYDFIFYFQVACLSTTGGCQRISTCRRSAMSLKISHCPRISSLSIINLFGFFKNFIY